MNQPLDSERDGKYETEALHPSSRTFQKNRTLAGVPTSIANSLLILRQASCRVVSHDEFNTVLEGLQFRATCLTILLLHGRPMLPRRSEADPHQKMRLPFHAATFSGLRAMIVNFIF